MSKQEFLDRLRAALNGRISPAQVEENINYYQDYINSQMRSGKSEAEIMAILGDPRLIARTIIETSQPTDDVNRARSASGSSNYQDSTYRSSSQGTYSSYQNTGYQSKRKGFRMPGWLLTIIVFFVIIVLISLVFSVLSFLAPVIIVIVAVVFLVKLFRDWLN